MQLTTQQRIYVVTEFTRTNSITSVQRSFAAVFPGRRPPTDKTIKKLMQKFQDRGTVENQNAGRSGRRRSTWTPQNIDLIEQALLNNPRLSARRNGLGIPKSTFNEITKFDLNFHPYRMFIHNEIKAGDYQRRMNYCRWFLFTNS